MLPGTVAARTVPGLSLAAWTICLTVMSLYGPSVGPTQLSGSEFR